MLLISLLRTHSSIAFYLNTSQKIIKNCVFLTIFFEAHKKRMQYSLQCLPICNIIFDIFLLATRTFSMDCVRIECVYEIHCMYSVSAMSLKIYLFVHLINSSESFDSSSFLNWMDCRQLSISHLCSYGFPILCHRPHSMSAFIYLLSELCVLSRTLAAYTYVCAANMCIGFSFFV